MKSEKQTASLDVIIIGAGAAGLAAAAKLYEAKIHFEILEARDRIGGRAHTLTGLVPIEFGPEFIHGKADAVFKELQKQKLNSFLVPDAHFTSEHGKLLDTDEFWDDLAEVMKKIPKLSVDISMQKALEKTRGVSQDKKDLVSSFVQGFDASLIGEVSAKEILAAKAQVEDPEERKVGRTLDGYSVLLGKMSAAFRSKIQLGCEVHSVEWDQSGVKVTSSKGRVIQAKKALITLPIGVLKTVPGENGHVSFDPPLYEKAKALEGLQMGPVHKLVLKFKRDFWSEVFKVPVTMLHTPKKKFQTWWSASPMHWPLFTAWSGGDPALELSLLSPKEQEALALKEFSQILRLPLSKVRREFERSYFHDWSEDPYSRGAYSFVRAGGSGSREKLGKPLKNSLFFAGEATSPERNGTVDGAMESGIKAAAQLIRALSSSKR